MTPRGGPTGRPRARTKRRRLAVAVGAIAVAALLVYLFVFGRHGYLRQRELARENDRLARELERVREENEQLKRELAHLDDAEAVEKLAREELGLVRPGETVYRFVPAPAETSRNKNGSR